MKSWGIIISKITPVFLLLSGFALITLSSSCSFDRETNVETGNRKQILHYGNGDEPQELDPHLTTGVPEYHIEKALFEGLIDKRPSDLAIEPGVAESWTVSEDQLSYTFKFRDNARWSNGDPVTAFDFVYSWQRALKPELGNLYAYMFFYIKNAEAYFKGEISDFEEVGVHAPDARTLEVTLHSPTPFFLQLLDHHSYFPIHPPTIEKFGGMTKRGSQWTRPGNFVGNGPFVLKDWKLNRILTVEKSPTYWDADKVGLQEIRFYPIQNSSTEERMFRAGQLHITSRVPNEKIKWYRENLPDSLSITPYLGTYFYRFNTTVKPLGDVRVRKALSMSINRPQIVEKITKGGQIPAYTLSPPNINGFTSTSRIEYNVEKARQLLAEAGYPDGKGFPKLEVIFNTDESHRKIAIAVQQMWKKALNIDISLANQDWKVYLENESRLNYQISRAAWIGDYLDPNTFLDMFLTGGGNNRTGWSNSAYDAAIAAAGKAVAKEKRFEYFQEAERILVEESPIAPIYTYTRVTLISPSVRGWDPNLLDLHSYKYIHLQASE